jgi:4'-phosphopantetheinyl transferase EntD
MVDDDRPPAPGADDDPERTLLVRQLRAMVRRHPVWLAARRIADGPVHPGERCLYVGVDEQTRRATSSGRLVCRELLRAMGVAPRPILRDDGGAPRWPIGIGGTLAHDDAFAVGLAWAGGPLLWGIDVEPPLPLPAEILDDVVITDDERRYTGDDPVVARAVFCAKEAAFKATWPLHRRVLEFRDVVVSHPFLATPRRADARPTWAFADTPAGRVSVALAYEPRLVAVAHVRPDRPPPAGR